ncbi:glycine dehydrogenase (aminomethyl-transferring), partial [Methylobacterium radiotolerans]
MVAFADRHIGPTEAAQRTMLDALGLSADSGTEPGRGAHASGRPPPSIYTGPEDAVADSRIPGRRAETEALAELRALAGRNTVNRSMIGLGYYGTVTPQ